jgi:UDP-glucose 4-epimerase
MTTAILTGASGFIAGQLLPRLSSMYDTVVTISRRGVKKVASNHVDIPLSLYWATENRDLPQYCDLECVYHFAGCSSPRPNHDKPNEVFDANVNFTNLLLSQYAKTTKRFVFASTIKVYGETIHSRDESYGTFPTCLYGISKVAAEQCVKLYAKEYEFDYEILRLCPILSRCRKTGLVAYLKSQMLSGKFDIDVPDVMRPYLHISDAINGILEFKPPNQIWNLASNCNIMAMDIARYMQSRLDMRHGTNLHLAKESSWDMDTRRIDVDTHKLAEFWQPKMTILETIEDVITQ